MSFKSQDRDESFKTICFASSKAYLLNQEARIVHFPTLDNIKRIAAQKDQLHVTLCASDNKQRPTTGSRHTCISALKAKLNLRKLRTYRLVPTVSIYQGVFGTILNHTGEQV
jgi:hypothetical protein